MALIFLACIGSGMGLTFHSGLSMQTEERFFAGWVLGIVAFTLTGIVSTRLFSFAGWAVVIATAATVALSVPGWRRGAPDFCNELSDLRNRLKEPILSGRNPILLAALLIPAWALIGRLFFLAYQTAPDGGLMVGHLASFSDWQAHLTYTASFAYADNTALDLPLATGNNIGYHAGINYFAALLIPAGATLPGALQVSGAFTLFAFPGAMYCAGMRVFGRQAVALLGTTLFLFFGGWGFLDFFSDWADGGVDALTSLPRTYTRLPDLPVDLDRNWWNANPIVLENPIVGHFFPQRPTMIGFPIVILVLGWLYTAWTIAEQPDGAQPESGAAKSGAAESGGPESGAAEQPDGAQPESGGAPADWRRSVPGSRTFLFCGILIGLTPFFSLFAFGVPLAFVGLWWIATRFRVEWLYVLIPASILALPAVIFLQPPSSSLEYPYDWVEHIRNPGGIPADLSPVSRVGHWFTFWFRNLGFFVPLLIAAQAVRGVLPKRVAMGLMPVWLFFVVPNAIKPHPWNGNNTHYFIFVLLIGALPVAALLVNMVRRSPISLVMVVPLVFTLVAAGFVDVMATNDQATSPWPLTAMDGGGIAVGEWARTTDPDAVFVIELGWAPGQASPHQHPVPALSGRDVVVGNDGWVFDLGIPDWATRKDHSRIILEAGAGYEGLIDLYDVDYLAIGPNERTPNWDPNTAFWEEVADVVYRHAGWTVYKV